MITIEYVYPCGDINDVHTSYINMPDNLPDDCVLSILPLKVENAIHFHIRDQSDNKISGWYKVEDSEIVDTALKEN